MQNEYLTIFSAVLQGVISNPNHQTDKLIESTAIAKMVDEIARASYAQFLKTQLEFSKVNSVSNELKEKNQKFLDSYFRDHNPQTRVFNCVCQYAHSHKDAFPLLHAIKMKDLLSIDLDTMSRQRNCGNISLNIISKIIDQVKNISDGS